MNSQLSRAGSSRYLYGFYNLILIVKTRNYSSLKNIERLLSIIDLASNPSRHMKVMKAIGAKELHPVLLKQPQAPIKYLHRRYLALDLSTSQRAAMFCYHYQYASMYFSQSLVEQVLSSDLQLWSYSDSDHTHRIGLKLSHFIDNEGELTAEYIFDATPIFAISFTIINASIIGLMAEPVLFVTRVQGMRDNFTAVRQATKLLKEISPPFAIIAALQGFTTAFAIRGLIGVPVEQQVCFDNPGGKNELLYDRFFEALGAITLAELDPPSTRDAAAARRHGGYFYVSLPSPEKPIMNIERSHRRRTVAKRKFRRQISDMALQAATDSASATFHTSQ